MMLKTYYFLFVCFIAISMALSSCMAGQGQPSVSPTALTIENTSTLMPATSTSTVTATPTRLPTLTMTPLLTATPTIYPIEFPPDCGKVKLGRAGTQVIDHISNILIQGTAIMCGAVYVDSPFEITLPVLQGMLDLDTGTFNVEDADLQFCPGGGSTLYYYFCDVNHTMVRKYQAYEKPKQPPFEECLGTKPYSGIDDDEAKYLCVVTTLGNISRVKVEQYDPVDGILSFKISFITWEKP